MKKVLIALDYDPSSRKVAEVGYSMAQVMSADVVLLHVLVEPIYYSSADFSPIIGFMGYSDSNPALMDSLEGIKEFSMSFLQKIKNQLGNDSITCVVKEGVLATEIIKTAKEYRADVIAIGSHSRGWLEKAIMGTVTENVLKNSKIPILIIPSKRKK